MAYVVDEKGNAKTTLNVVVRTLHDDVIAGKGVIPVIAGSDYIPLTVGRVTPVAQ